jgi:hypothetical protein
MIMERREVFAALQSDQSDLETHGSFYSFREIGAPFLGHVLHSV